MATEPSAQDKEAAAKVQKWIGAITAYEREFKKWETRAERIVKIYRDYDNQSDRSGQATTFNILWSNIQTTLPAVFARLPKPDVSRRFGDNDQVGRVAALILERALEFEIDLYPDYRAAVENSVLDRFLGGRGQSWVRYEPHFKAAELGTPEDGLQVTEDADESAEAEQDEEAQAPEVIDYECAPVDYVHWKDFGHTVARTWEEVTAVWRKVYMTREALVKRFGDDLGYKIPLDTKPDDSKRNTAAPSGEEQFQACVFEIWDRTSKKAIWLSRSMSKILDERDDFLNLLGFFPCPRPLFSTITTDNLIPVPDYKLYQDQARSLNTLADRIDGLIEALKVKGVYDAAQPELARLFKEAGNGDLIPIKNWQAFAEKAGLKGSIDIFDLTPIVKALNEAYQAVAAIKNEVYEVMGIADIIRGSSDPQETATAVRTKGQFGSLRLRGMQGKVVQYATEILQIKAQIMCQCFQPETLATIAAADQLAPQDRPLVPKAMQLLLGERMADPEASTTRSTLHVFRIEVSSDSMVQLDEVQEKADRVQFLEATGNYLQKALPVIQQNPKAGPLLVGLLKFGVTGFKVGKSIEGLINEALDQMQQAAAMPQDKPDPEMAKIQANSVARQQEMQVKAQLDDRRIQAEKELEQWRQTMQAQQIAHQNQLEAQRAALQAQHEAQLEAQRQENAKQLQAMQTQVQIILKHIDAAAKIEVARVTAKNQTDDGGEAYQYERSKEE